MYISRQINSSGLFCQFINDPARAGLLAFGPWANSNAPWSEAGFLLFFRGLMESL
jgi:hypothetical protein